MSLVAAGSADVGGATDIELPDISGTRGGTNGTVTERLLELLPPMWAEIKPLDGINFPTDVDGKYIVDVWDYKGRMALYKHMIENTKHCSWESNPAVQDRKINPNNIIWGLPLQHGWQFSSGRLFSPANR
jgi:Leg1